MTSTQHDTLNLEGVREISPEEGFAMFDREARRMLNISGEEFLRRWESGEYDEAPEQPGIARLVFLSEFAKQD